MYFSPIVIFKNYFKNMLTYVGMFGHNDSRKLILFSPTVISDYLNNKLKYVV
jgi:hypothetical protein